MNINLKLGFLERNVSQIETAVTLGMDPARLSKIIRGWVSPTANERQSLAAYLKKNEAELFPKERADG